MKFELNNKLLLDALKINYHVLMLNGDFSSIGMCLDGNEHYSCADRLSIDIIDNLFKNICSKENIILTWLEKNFNGSIASWILTSIDVVFIRVCRNLKCQKN